MQPGIAGHSATSIPVSSGSIVTGNFTLGSYRTRTADSPVWAPATASLVDIDRQKVLPLATPATVVPRLDGEPDSIFYRAAEFSASPPIMEARYDQNGAPELTLYGEKGSNYRIEYATEHWVSGW